MPTLIFLAETNEQLAPQVVEVLERKFAKKTLEFRDPYQTGEVGNNVQEEFNSIYIRHFETASKVLKNHGNLIQKVRILHRNSSNEMSNSIYKSVNLFCSETLKNIEIDAYSHINSLGDFTKPFKTVDYVTLYGPFSAFGSDEFNFAQMFPALQHLVLFDIRSQDLSWVNQTYPHLETLLVDISKSADASDRLTNTLVGQLIASNPQIRNINLRHPSWQLMKIAAKQFLNLEKLKIKRYIESSDDDVNTNLAFENVISLEIMHGSKSVPMNSTFGQLEKFTTDALPSTCFRWIDLIAKTKTLKRLNVYRELKNVEFQRLSLVQSDLERAFVMCAEDMQGETIVKFIENNQKLQKFVVRLGMTTMEPIEQVLREKVGKYFWITAENWKIYLYRKRNPN